MAIRGLSLIPSTVTKTLVCVDGINEFEIVGTLLNPYMPKPVKFNSIYDILSILEGFFDKISFPQAYCEDRTFINAKAKPQSEWPDIKSGVQQYMADDIFKTEQGKKATFVIQVQFRQNASWQGTITWTNEKKTQNFRSTLEMIKLMDDALAGNAEPGADWE